MPCIRVDVHVLRSAENELFPDHVQKTALLLRPLHAVDEHCEALEGRPHVHARKVGAGPSFGVEESFVGPVAVHRRRLADHKAGYKEIGVADKLRKMNFADRRHSGYGITPA